MGAKTLQAYSSEPKYQAEFRVEAGGVDDLLMAWRVGCCAPHEPRLWVRNSGGTQRFEILVKQITNLGVWAFCQRADWEIVGYLMGEPGKKYAREENGRAILPEVILEYNTHIRRGTLRVLAHDQPAPVIEVIEWCQMVDRANKRRGDVLEIRYERSGKILRGVIKEAGFFNDRFIVKCEVLLEYSHSDLKWWETGHDILRSLIPHQNPDAPKPLVYKDGRILFEVPGSNGMGRVSCVIYPQRSIGW